MSSGRYFCPISTEVEFSWQNAPNFCPISTEVEFSWQMLPIFVRFQPKSNFLDKCSQFLSDFNQSRILLTNTPRRKLCDEDIVSKLICDTDWDHGAEDTEWEEEEDAYGGDERTVTSNATRADSDVSTALSG